MLIYYNQQELIKFIRAEIKAWEKIGGGPNLNAFEYDPKEIDPKELHALGYYDNIDAWVAGARIKALTELLQKINEAATIVKK